MADFSDSQVGKRVVAQSGTTVGEVTDVRDGGLYVAVDPDADPDVLDDLRWEGVVNRETHELDEKHVSKITEDTIRLRV